MATVDIYTSKTCPYCIKAKNLLESKGVDYREFRTDQDMTLAEEVVKRSGGKRTVPQIFIDGNHVGGCDELYALEREGSLDSMLGV
ncbi:MAG: glutaredoxin 3 [Desulfobacteraceae bacterium]|nr:glutaredoxin 3 [Desulfobacteraceae bacterium]